MNIVELAHWKTEQRAFWRLVPSILATQLLQMAYGVTDTIVAGHISPVDLAAVAIGHGLFFTASMGAAGIMFAGGTLIAHAYGAKNYKLIGKLHWQGLWLALVIGLIVAVSLNSWSHLAYEIFDTDKDIIPLASDYINFVVLGLPALLYYFVLRAYFEGMNRPQIVTYLTFVGVMINIVLDIVFCFGYLGFPEMGAAGCGLATATVTMLQVVAGVVIMRHWSMSKTTEVTRICWPDWALIKQHLVIGFPISLTLFIEISMFSGAALIVSGAEPAVLAGHQIALNIASIAFMLPLALGLAATVRIGNLLGAGKQVQVAFATKFALWSAVAVSVFNTAWVFALRDLLPHIYTNDSQAILIASQLLIWAAIFQFPDGIQGVCLHILRGFQKTLPVSMATVLAYWVVALPLGFILFQRTLQEEPMCSYSFCDSYDFSNPAEAMWLAMVIGLILMAGLLLVLIYRELRFQKHKLANRLTAKRAATKPI